MGRILPANVHAYASVCRAYNKVLHSDKFSGEHGVSNSVGVGFVQ